MNIIFKTIYKLWNRASWSKINSINDLSEKGYLKLKLNQNLKTKLDFELEKIYNRALDTVKFYNVAEDHFQRTLYFYMIKFRNIFRKPVSKYN